MKRTLLVGVGGFVLGGLLTALSFHGTFDTGFQRGFVFGLQSLEESARGCLHAGSSPTHALDCIVQSRVWKSEASRRQTGMQPEFSACPVATMRCHDDVAQLCWADVKQHVAAWRIERDCKATGLACVESQASNGVVVASCKAAE